MIDGKTVAVVIPCRNEAAGLAALLPARPPEVDDIIVVDNNSTDETVAVAKAHGARVVFEHRPGYGATFQAGFRAVTADIVVTMDGDAQYDIRDIPRLVRIFQARKLDVLSTNRFPLARGSMPAYRHIGNAALTATAWLIFGYAIRDTQSGMWVFSRSCLDRIGAREPGMAYSEEFKLKAVRAGLAFGETHIRYLPRVGDSKLVPFGDGWKNLVYLFRLRFQRL